LANHGDLTERDKVKSNFHKTTSGMLLAIVFILILASGCAWWKKKETETTPQGLYENAMNLLQEKKYEKAGQALQKFNEEYPLNEYTPLVELRTADVAFFSKKYAEAIVLYEEFKKLHPTHQEVPYAIYQVGMCHYNQMYSLDRDQTETEKAAEQFRYLIENFPQSEHAADAKAHMQLCLKRLADHEFYVGQFYFRTKKYKAALSRFEGILQKYPECGFGERVKSLMETCKSKIASEERRRKEKEAQQEKKKKEREDKKKAKKNGIDTSG
jgi:outer membrane protein assembly factor BamD